MIEKIELKIKGETIKLDQLLKFSDIVSSGGEAKILIAEEKVKLNQIIVTERGKKIKKNDIVYINYFGKEYQIKIT